MLVTSLNHPLLIAIYVPGMVHDRKAAEGALFGDLAVEVFPWNLLAWR